MRDPIRLGLVLAIANAIVIAVGLAIAVPWRDLAGAIAILAAPALPIGALTGGIALVTDERRPWFRLCWMTPLPLGYVVVVVTGLEFGAAGYGALIPTFISVLLLERWSRVPASGAELPRARATTRS
jgi:hypothetical protein